MQFSTIVAILSIAATTSAAPTAAAEKRGLECPGSGSYYVCAKNGFRGYCSSDPCDKQWCGDFQPFTCDKAPKKEEPPVKVPVAECPGSGAYYVCAKNGFRGYCSSDPCDKQWCADFKPSTCDKVQKEEQQPAKVPAAECPGSGAYYVCASNGFRGYCSSDPCAQEWCPDFTAKTCDKKTSTWTPPVDNGKGKDNNNNAPVDGVCGQGKGYFQVCSNGFRGCCKQDACALGWCPSN